MARTIALLIGVSRYEKSSGLLSLPYVINDLVYMKQALCDGLSVSSSDIYTIGSTGRATTINSFINQVDAIKNHMKNDDTFIFYFSGHGGRTPHCLAFSDEFIEAGALVAELDKLSAKTKILIFDCCNAGNCELPEFTLDTPANKLQDFFKNGYALLASSSETQSSHKHPQEDVSLFTYFLSYAITNRSLIYHGKKSLYNIQKSVRLYMDVFSQKSGRMQHPVFRSEIGGPILFPVEQYQPYDTVQIYKDTDEFTICSIKPIHTGSVKRYVITAIPKAAEDMHDIAKLTKDIVAQVKYAEVYSSEIAEKRLRGCAASLISINWAMDSFDVDNNNHAYISTWVDDTLDKEWWYRHDNVSSFFVDDICIKYLTTYDLIRELTERNIAKDEMLIKQTRDLADIMIASAKKIIQRFLDYRNGDISESIFRSAVQQDFACADAIFFKSTNLPLPSPKLKVWANAYDGLFGDIHDFVLFYSASTFLNRDPQNRILCMEGAIDRYYKDLERIEALENELEI